MKKFKSKSKSIKKITAIVLVLAMLLSFAACGGPAAPEEKNQGISMEEGKYPVDFDFTLLYKSDDDWYKDYDRYMDLIKNFASFEGTLNNADDILAFIEEFSTGEAALLLDKLDMYVYAGIYMFPGENSFKILQAKLDTANEEWDKQTEILYKEVLALPYEERLEIFSDPRLEKYTRYYTEFMDPDAFFDEDAEEDFSNLYTGRAENLYNTFLFADFVGPEFTMPDGEVIQMTEQDYEGIWHGDYDRKTKLDAYNTWWDAVSQYSNTLAYIYESYMLEQYAAAKEYGFETTKEFYMDMEELPADIADRVIAVCRTALDKTHQVYETYGKAAGDGDYYIFDFDQTLSSYKPGFTEYDDAVDMIIEGLTPLGEDYIDTFKEIMTSGFIDVYPKIGKSGGAFSSGGYADIPPYIMFNYSGNMRDIDAVAHEMGHAVYSEYSRINQPYHYISPGIFTQEIASTTNEYIFCNYMAEHAESDEEKMLYVELQLREFMDALFRQCMYEEIEMAFYEIIERGDFLDPEECCNIFETIAKEYFGEGFTVGESGRYFWSTQEHYFSGYYVFKYATSACYASYIASKIGQGDKDMLDKYLNFLTLGNSMDPEGLLATMDIDINSDECFEFAIEYFNNLADTFLELNEKINGSK